MRHKSIFFLLLLMFNSWLPAQCWRTFDSGGFLSAGIKEDGTIWHWGHFLGGGPGPIRLPVQVGTDNDWDKVMVGYHYIIAIKNNGTMWSWGNNTWGQLGLGDYNSRTLPTQIGTDNDWEYVDGNNQHIMAIKRDGSLWGWGLDEYGELAMGSVIGTPINIPTRIGTDTDWKKISCSTNFTVGLKRDNTLWMTGGIPASTNNPIIGMAGSITHFERVGYDNDWKDYETSFGNIYAIKFDGSLWTVGGNNNGTLGIGTFNQFLQRSFTRIGTDNDWKEVAGGTNFGIALKNNGTLWTWGFNLYGQLGDGTYVDKSSPVQIGTETNWAKLGRSYNIFAAILKTDKTIWGFGENGYGSLGDNTLISKNYPVQVQMPGNQVIAITASSPVICGNTPVVLTSSIPTGNTWSTGATTPSITITTPGTYTLMNSEAGCAPNATITINRELEPDFSITGNLKICGGQPSILSVSTTETGLSYSWSTGATTPSITITNGGVYTLTVTTPGGCSYTKSVTVTANPGVNVSIATPQQITCANHTVTLNANASTFPVGSTIQWVASNGGNIVSGGDTLTPVVDAAGTYTLTITSSGGFVCSDTKSVTVTGNTSLSDITLSASKLKICPGEKVILTASGGTDYVWEGLSGNGATQEVMPSTTTTYTVKGQGGAGCSAANSVSVTIEVLPILAPRNLQSQTICPRESVVLDGSVEFPDATYQWSNGATTPIINVNSGGIYTVTINNGSCRNVYTAVVTVSNTIKIIEVKYIKGNLVIEVENPNNLTLEYSIDGGATWQESRYFANVDKNKWHIIKARAKGRPCYSEMKFFTYFLPNTITPNNDNINDVVDFSSFVKEKDFNGGVSDRYGATVFKPTDSKPVWNGKLGSKNLSTGTYWYMMSWKDKETGIPVTYNGWILLKNK